MSPFVAEFVGTAFLIVLGDGVVANVLLRQSKGNNGGWIVIAFGWSMAVFVGVYTSAAASGGHLNPAVSLALAVLGKFEWAMIPGYIAAQLAGACTGAALVWLIYRLHFDASDNKAHILAVFCTAPAIRNTVANFTTECTATFIFMLAILFISAPESKLGALDALPVSLLVLGIGLSLGGPTGYAINPARDLGPRIMHAILPIREKGESDWSYAWIPVAGPVIGALLAAGVYGFFQTG
jgi:glycerol uptake facilitator protein